MNTLIKDSYPEDPSEVYVDFEGYRFKRPFRCMCCGKEIDAGQFAYGRACGACDMGACERGNRAFQFSAAHQHPAWWNHDRQELIRKFAEAVGAKTLKGAIDV